MIKVWLIFQTPGVTKDGRTPMRTPKTIHRRPVVENDQSGRILGTPDYLAPELLLQKEHSEFLFLLPL